MQAIILAGGEGTRLRPLTCNLPKGMVPIINIPFLEHVIRHLKGYGIEEFLITLHYLPDRVQSYFGDGASQGVKIGYLVENTPLGTAGGVKNAQPLVKDTFLVLNGDIFATVDLQQLLAFHKGKQAAATIVLTPVDDPTQYGVVERDSNDRVHRFLEKPPREQVTSPCINAGWYILEPWVLEEIPSGVPYMFERGLFPKLLEMGAPVYGYPSPGYWIDMGTPQKYMKLHTDLLTQSPSPSLLGRPHQSGIWMETGCQVHPSAQLQGPILLGAGCVIEARAQVNGPAVLGPGCHVCSGALVQESILWDNVLIKDQARVLGSILSSRVRVDYGAVVPEGSVLAEEVFLGAGYHLQPSTILWPGEVRTLP